jgi:hypothetical protein
MRSTLSYLPASTGRFLALADNPRPSGCKELNGYKDQWRVRFGDWRALYLIDDAAKVVTTTRIAHRREAYAKPHSYRASGLGRNTAGSGRRVLMTPSVPGFPVPVSTAEAPAPYHI